MNIILGSLLIIVIVWLFAKLLSPAAKPVKPVAGHCFVTDREFFAVSREFRQEAKMKKSALNQVIDSIQEWTLFTMSRKEIISSLVNDQSAFYADWCDEKNYFYVHIEVAKDAYKEAMYLYKTQQFNQCTLYQGT